MIKETMKEETIVTGKTLTGGTMKDKMEMKDIVMDSASFGIGVIVCLRIINADFVMKNLLTVSSKKDVTKKKSADTSMLTCIKHRMMNIF